MRRRGKRARDGHGVDRRVLSGMANSLRTQILVILNERMASATEIALDLGLPFHKVNYQVGVLKKANAIREVGGLQVRGATERFYSATTRVCIDREEWPTIGKSVKGNLRASLLETIIDEAAGAISDDVYDSLEEAHMSWIPMILDGEGWTELTAILKQSMEDIVDLQERAKQRLSDQDEAGIPCSVSMLGHPTSLDARKVAPSETPSTSEVSEEQKS